MAYRLPLKKEMNFGVHVRHLAAEDQPPGL